jgi:hypothetical protein
VLKISGSVPQAPDAARPAPPAEAPGALAANHPIRLDIPIKHLKVITTGADGVETVWRSPTPLAAELALDAIATDSKDYSHCSVTITSKKRRAEQPVAPK